MVISRIEIYKFSIPMHPFTIATGTMHFAQNILVRVSTDTDLSGLGECSAFPMIVGETQNTCFEMAREFAGLWKGKDPLMRDERLGELDSFTAFNSTIKSAFDMALFDLAAKDAGLPLYRFLGGKRRELETDLTIGIGTPQQMAAQAADYKERGVRIIKIKLGKDARTDVLRVAEVRKAVGASIKLRIDANQGWTYDDAVRVLQEVGNLDIEFCEQPMRTWDDEHLPELRKKSPVKIMADESVFDHHDAKRIIQARACDYINIKMAKSGGIAEAKKICNVCSAYGVPCMMGGMLESKLALTAFAHFVLAQDGIVFYDMDTCLLGHKVDPVIGGVRFKDFCLEIPDAPGIGAEPDPQFLRHCERIEI
ncbi:MAG TPA: dipeptide epimerase [Puia sp.]|nr:dipeptide epimerase [Puia sp.]